MPERHPLDVDDLWAIPRVGEPEPLPDGRAVIVPVTETAMEANESRGRLWWVPVAGPDAPRPLTGADASASAPAVSPDGRHLAFLRKPGGPPAPAPDAGAEAASRFAGLGLGGPGAGPRFPDQPQVYLLDLSGGEAARLTDLPLGAGAPVWLPDGRLGFSAPLLAQAPTLAGTAALAAERAKDPVSARVTEDRVYRFWDRWLTEGRVEHILLLDLADDRLIDLTPGWTRWLGLSEGGRAFAAAPDSGEIAFEACRSTPPHSPLVFGVYRQAVPARGASAEGLAEPRLLHPEHPGPAMRPRYSPDGAWIVYGLQREIGFYADPVRLMAFERASGRHRPLTEAWDNSAESWTFGADATRLLLVAQEGAHNAVWAIDLAAVEAPADHPPRVLARGGWLGEPRPVGPWLCCSHQSLTEPPELALLDLETGRPERLTRFTEPAMADLALGAVEEVFFAGAEGDRVQMYLVHPPELPADPGPAGVASGTAGGRQPGARGRSLVHLVHGGPHGVFGDQWHWRWNAHAFAARGHLVALVNFHGSTGFGEAYTRSILGQWGARPAADLQAATDWLIAERGVDPARMAIAGGSYGGYLVSWLAGETDRFACIVNHAGVSDFQTQFASDITQGRRKSMGGELWEDLAGLDRFNPIRRAASFRSPMLVIHGEKDYRVPYNQGLVIYNVYQARGLPARLVVYADENHWILKPRNSRHWYGEVLDWIERWLGGQALYSAGAAADSTGGP